MKSNVVLVASLIVVCLTEGCASTQPTMMSGPSDMTPAAAFDCSQTIVNALSFTPVQMSRESGFLKAERKTSGLASAILANVNSFDGITLSIFKPMGSAGTTINISAETDAEKAMGWGAGHRNSSPASPRLQADMNLLLNACSTSEKAAKIAAIRVLPQGSTAPAGCSALGVVNPGAPLARLVMAAADLNANVINVAPGGNSAVAYNCP